MKRIAFVVIAVFSSHALAAITVRYHNGDSQKHTFEAVCSGSRSQLVTDGNTTGSATIQGSGPCKVKHAGGEVSLSGGENIDIKNGKIAVK